MALIVFAHGLSNRRPADAWTRIAATELRKQGHLVGYPQLPNPEAPNRDDWVDVLRTEIALLRDVRGGDEELMLVGHSLGCLALLNLFNTDALREAQAARTLLVAPADPAKVTAAPTFVLDLEADELLAAVRRNTRELLVLGSASDPWQPRGLAETFGHLGTSATTVIVGAGHLTAAEGWGPWPGLVDWVNDPSADITRR